MGGRGSGGSRGGGGGNATNNLNKQIDNISQKVVTRNEFRDNYRFYDQLNNTDLINAQKITRKKFLNESDKYDKMLHNYEQASYNIPTLKDNRFQYDTSSREWKNYKKLERNVEKQLLKTESLQRSLKNVNSIMDKRGLKY